MVHNEIMDLYAELTRLLSNEKLNGGKVYWWCLFDYRVICTKYDTWLYIKLPEPKLHGYGYASLYVMKKRNEAEVERVRNIWTEFIRIFKEKMDRVDSGQSTLEGEFKEGILFENGEYGLKYGKDWKIGAYENDRATERGDRF